uniref:Uncharacterized protein n=1 Tax=Globodera rostochiensis TaxID=31243 RepID=A0A914I589_GLORO
MSFPKLSTTTTEISSLPTTVTSSPPAKFAETKWLGKNKRPPCDEKAEKKKKPTKPTEPKEVPPTIKKTKMEDSAVKPQESEPPVEKKRKVEDREIWKLMKGKYLLSFYLCPEDWKKLYNRENKVVRQENGHFAARFELCADCAWANVRATDYLAPPKNKKMDE